MTKRRTAAEIIAFHKGWDYAEMRDARYQSTRYANPAIYNNGGDYYAAPSNGKMPRNYADLTWNICGEEYGRTIFKACG